MKAQKTLIVAGKGGVGKTTIAVNMAVHWAQQDLEVGLLDADIHSPNIPRLLGITPQGAAGLASGIEPVSPMKGLKVVSLALFLHNQDISINWRGPIKQGVIKQFIADAHWGELDCLIVDLPPGTGDEAMSAVQFLTGLIGALIITTPQPLSLLEARRTAAFFRQHEVPVIGVVENMATITCPHCHREISPLGSGGGEALADDLEIPFVGSIPIDPAAGGQGEPFILAHPDAPISCTVREIALRCQELLEERGRLTLCAGIVYRGR